MRTNGMKLRGAARSAIAAVLLTASAASTWADEQILTLSAARAQKLAWLMYGPEGDWSQVGPEGDWSHLRGVLVGTGVTFLASCDQAGVAERESAILTFGKLVFEDVIVPAGGAIGGWLAAGTLAGIELDLFGENDPMQRPSASEHLGTVGVLRVAIAESPGYEDVGFVYCLGATELAARLDALEDAPVAAIDVYPGPVLHSSGTGNYAMYLLTSDTFVQGEILTNGPFRLDGDEDLIPERLRFRGGTDIRGQGHVLGTLVDEPAETTLPAAPFSAGHYAALASANDTFFAQDITVVMGPSGLETSLGVPVGGVIYSTGDIIVSGAEISAALTLVAEGSIEFRGNSNAFTAFADGVLAWSVDDQDANTPNHVLIAGTDHAFTGRMYTHGGQFQLLGDQATIVGNVIARKVLISGDGHTIGDGTLR